MVWGVAFDDDNHLRESSCQDSDAIALFQRHRSRVWRLGRLDVKGVICFVTLLGVDRDGSVTVTSLTEFEECPVAEISGGGE